MSYAHTVYPTHALTYLSLWRGDIPLSRQDQTPAQTRRDILAWSAFDYGLTVESMLLGSRRRDRVRARQTAAYRLRCERTASGEHRYSMPRIARILGYDDHTTIIHGIRKIMAINGWPTP